LDRTGKNSIMERLESRQAALADLLAAAPYAALPYLAVEKWLSPAVSIPFFLGMTGGVARTAADTPSLSDLRAMLLPGLAALGLRAELRPLPEEDAALRRCLNERLRHTALVLVYAFPGEPEIVSSEQASSPEQEAAVSADTGDGERKATRQALLVAIETGGEFVVRADTQGQEIWETAAGFRGAFTHWLRVTRAQTRGSRRANVRAALLRWLAFSDAYPDRILTSEAGDAALRAYAAAFLREIIGRQRRPFATRLRWAADAFDQARSEAYIQTALYYIRLAVLLDLRLPAVMQGALLAPPVRPLNDIERRELIYLARAGTRDIKALATRRLTYERHHGDVCSTLQQLAHDADAWVRAAALSATTG